MLVEVFRGDCGTNLPEACFAPCKQIAESIKALSGCTSHGPFPSMQKPDRVRNTELCSFNLYGIRDLLLTIRGTYGYATM